MTAKDVFNRVACKASVWTGSPSAFILAITLILVWATFGPAMNYSQLWHLLLNSPTTAITFCMLFLLQHTQTRDTKALHLKLDELIRAANEARNDFIDVEHAADDVMDELKKTLHDGHES